MGDLHTVGDRRRLRRATTLVLVAVQHPMRPRLDERAATLHGRCRQRRRRSRRLGTTTHGSRAAMQTGMSIRTAARPVAAASSTWTWAARKGSWSPSTARSCGSWSCRRACRPSPAASSTTRRIRRTCSGAGAVAAAEAVDAACPLATWLQHSVPDTGCELICAPFASAAAC